VDLRELESKADIQLLEHRAYIERRERDHQKESDNQQRQMEQQQRQHSDLIGKIMCDKRSQNFSIIIW
jgi:hypothetical protein